jgi:hypothetical protein
MQGSCKAGLGPLVPGSPAPEQPGGLWELYFCTSTSHAEKGRLPAEWGSGLGVSVGAQSLVPLLACVQGPRGGARGRAERTEPWAQDSGPWRFSSHTGWLSGLAVHSLSVCLSRALSVPSPVPRQALGIRSPLREAIGRMALFACVTHHMHKSCFKGVLEVSAFTPTTSLASHCSVRGGEGCRDMSR